ncbi:MAG: hypothetical protein H8E44_04150 [Planctomycetes bacterium]|nr:hypothetical protein [Planctomycetota bacterium]MBL7042275.1 hypothetical protein [Pirellulaceae bacterium]
MAICSRIATRNRKLILVRLGFFGHTPREHGDFPVKWMSKDGETAYLVFSGDDYFCVRNARFRLTALASGT